MKFDMSEFGRNALEGLTAITTEKSGRRYHCGDSSTGGEKFLCVNKEMHPKTGGAFNIEAFAQRGTPCRRQGVVSRERRVRNHAVKQAGAQRVELQKIHTPHFAFGRKAWRNSFNGVGVDITDKKPNNGIVSAQCSGAIDCCHDQRAFPNARFEKPFSPVANNPIGKQIGNCCRRVKCA